MTRPPRPSGDPRRTRRRPGVIGDVFGRSTGTAGDGLRRLLRVDQAARNTLVNAISTGTRFPVGESNPCVASSIASRDSSRADTRFDAAQQTRPPPPAHAIERRGRTNSLLEGRLQRLAVSATSGRRGPAGAGRRAGIARDLRGPVSGPQICPRGGGAAESAGPRGCP